MSTQKNEQYHILSPEWLASNPLPEDAEVYLTSSPARWAPSTFRGGIVPLESRTLKYRSSVDPGITPPTDTTGSGREGETPDTVAMFKRLLDFRGSDLADEFFADVAKLERQRDAAIAQVEALRTAILQVRNAPRVFDHCATEVCIPVSKIPLAISVPLRAAIDSAQRQEGK